MSQTPVWSVLARIFGSAGVDACYGEAFGQMPVVRVEKPVAFVFCKAHARVHNSRAAIHLGDGEFVLPSFTASLPRADHGTFAIDHVGDLARLEPEISHEWGARIRLRVDPSAPVDGRLPEDRGQQDSWKDLREEDVERVSNATSVVGLAGPGVVREFATDGLHDLAVAAGIGVLNTWGAKGVFDWRSRHHLATIGLQELDFELGGLREAELILATGLDPTESPEARWKLAPSVDIAPGALGALAEHLAPRRTGRSEIAVPPIRHRLASVTQRGWGVDGAPLPPSRVTRNYARVLGNTGLLAADPGNAGFWVARTFATTGRRSGVIVPAERDLAGFACACAVVDRLRRPMRPVLAVVDELEDADHQVLEGGLRLGVRVSVEAWTPDGDRLDADAHIARLEQIVSSPRSSVVSLATDASQLEMMVEAAGPIVAWT